MAAAQRAWAANLVHFWFHKLEPEDWWGGSEQVTAYLLKHYERWLCALCTQPAHSFLSDPRTALGAVLLFDQVPRNIYPDSAKAFAFDPLARHLTRAILDKGWDKHYTTVQRQFLGLPLMHSEHIEDQCQCLAYFAKLGPKNGLPFARDHYAMIARFGRYPHRNSVLGRKTTPAEQRAIDAGFVW